MGEGLRRKHVASRLEENRKDNSVSNRVFDMLGTGCTAVLSCDFGCRGMPGELLDGVPMFLGCTDCDSSEVLELACFQIGAPSCTLPLPSKLEPCAGMNFV